MYPSLDSARFDSVLTRVFREKARLGSARSLSLKTRSMEKGLKRVDLNHDAKPINIIASQILMGDTLYNQYAV